MLRFMLQILVGFAFLLGGSATYVQRGGAGALLLLVVGAILITVGAVVLGVREALRDESNRREQESKPVLNI